MENKIAEHPIKILLVDDKKENLLSLQVILANKGYQFVEASSGKDALRILLKSQDFAIILMDVQMPLMDGFETAEMIRQSDKLKHVPIIFLTANMNTTEYIFKGYQSGAVDYMIKPLSKEILQAKVSVFTELYKKNLELRLKEEETNALNEIILKTNKTLAAQYAAIEKHAAELKNKNMELDAFTYISSHDLQEPLRKIQTFVNVILSNEYPNLSADGKLKFERILYSTTRMRELISSLLTFSRTNIIDRKFESTDLNLVFADVKEALRENIQEKKVVIETDFNGNIDIIPFQFVQLLENLVSNAIKFAKKDMPLQITIKSLIADGATLQNEKLSPQQKYCYITFEDNGIGFEPQHSEKIFGVFQRLHGRDLYEGTGIGLAIVKKIVENHNGFITASSIPMEGVKFTIYIPV
ncbi:response regulator [Flavobacterium pectinovorum]|jgi:signal transduction histidine kinase|uniref:histidine kinase n=1 Tax=Flavobacterium pectinovorum TaxID=29533 RepID=A0A502EI97_9FLAO|nr:response regulator [Flavobacterium pectinovorum]TPG36210.1 hybrid sensor histidine kinase/response regulator [Flavobacterium pectinovorum]